MSNITTRVRFNSVTVYSIGVHDLEISGEMDVSIRLCDDVASRDPARFDLAESIAEIDIDSARVPATGRKIKIVDGSRLIGQLMNNVKVRDRLLDEAQQLGWEAVEGRRAKAKNGE